MDCVEVCPVDCFYEGKNMLVIKPDECIDCGVCEPECPVDAIVPDTESGNEKWIELNKKYSEIWPNISEKKDGQGNIIFDGEIKNIGGRRADFVKVDLVFRKYWSGETKTLTTFVKGSYNTFDTGIVSDASMLPGAI